MPRSLTPRSRDAIVSAWLRGELQSRGAAAARGAPEARAAAALPSLESSTLEALSVAGPEASGIGYLSHGHTRQTGLVNLTLTEYPEGWRGCAWQSRDPPKPRDPCRAQRLKGESERWDSAKVRARARVRHLCRCLGVDHLWTFTKRGKFADLDELWSTWREFCRLMAVRFPNRSWDYVVVPELHADGDTWHIHVGVIGFWDVNTLRVLWHRALGAPGLMRGSESPGNVDAQYKAKGRVLRSAREIARYIAGYIGKGFAIVSSGRRLFASTKGVRPLKCVAFHFVTPLTVEEFQHGFLELMRQVSGVPEWELFRYGEGVATVMVAEEAS